MGIKRVIYGYSSVGEAVYQEHSLRGQKVDCFCDDNTIKIVHAQSEVPVYTFHQLLEMRDSCHFIICIPNAEPIIKKIAAFDNMSWELASEYLQKEHYENFTYSLKNKSMAVREVESCEFYHNGLRNPEKLYIRNLDLEITEKCSLRCYNCCNLMQYYKKPKDYSADELLSDMQKLLKYVDGIYEVRILGGEPFMHKDVQSVLEGLKNIPQIKRIVILSNATIIPSDDVFQSMESEKIGLSFTNYGKLSRKLDEFCKKLDEMQIAYDVHEMGGWTLCSEIEKHNRSEQDLKEVYNRCCAKNLLTMLNGKLYICPFIANAMNLHAIPYEKDDVVDLKQLGDMDLDKAKGILSHFIQEKEFFASCDYCLGRDYDSEEIEPAVQASHPREYQIVGER